MLSNYRLKKYEKVLDFNDKKIDLRINNKKIITSIRDRHGMSLDKFRKEIKSLWNKINVESVIKRLINLCLLVKCQLQTRL